MEEISEASLRKKIIALIMVTWNVIPSQISLIALFRTMNEWQCFLLLKCELKQLLLVHKMLCAHLWDIELNSWREIPYLHTPMYIILFSTLCTCMFIFTTHQLISVGSHGEKVIQNWTLVIRGYLVSHLISIVWFYFNGRKIKKWANIQANA